MMGKSWQDFARSAADLEKEADRQEKAGAPASDVRALRRAAECWTDVATGRLKDDT